jgi:hypothetical protein
MEVKEFTDRFGMSPDEAMRKQADKYITVKAMFEMLDPLLDQIAALEKRDAASLLDAEAMRRAEKQVALIRDHCSAFLYHRSSPTTKDGASTKGLAPWLR